MPQSPDDMAAAMIANLKEKTGKTLPQWLKITKASKLAKHGELVKFLKGEHGVTHGFASLIAHKTIDSATFSADTGDLVGAQYSGPKAELRPIYDKLVKALGKFGKDCEVSPRKTYVTLRRSKQFAIIQASTKTRVDVGINLKGVKPTKRLEASGSFNSMVSHRVKLSSVEDVDDQLIKWLKQAYEKA